VQQCKTNLALTESLCSCHSLAVILIKKSFYKVFSFGCESGPWGLIKTWLCLQDSSKYSWLCARPEGPTPAKQDIGNHSNAPHICLSAIRSVEHLRSNIVCTSNNVIKSFICRKYNMTLWPTDRLNLAQINHTRGSHWSSIRQTWLYEVRQTKIYDLQGRVFILWWEKKILQKRKHKHMSHHIWRGAKNFIDQAYQ
jgi:hypothetical protein